MDFLEAGAAGQRGPSLWNGQERGSSSPPLPPVGADTTRGGCLCQREVLRPEGCGRAQLCVRVGSGVGGGVYMQWVRGRGGMLCLSMCERV